MSRQTLQTVLGTTIAVGVVFSYHTTSVDQAVGEPTVQQSPADVKLAKLVKVFSMNGGKPF